jgi:hypothetical protein
MIFFLTSLAKRYQLARFEIKLCYRIFILSALVLQPFKQVCVPCVFSVPVDRVKRRDDDVGLSSLSWFQPAAPVQQVVLVIHSWQMIVAVILIFLVSILSRRGPLPYCPLVQLQVQLQEPSISGQGGCREM